MLEKEKEVFMSVEEIGTWITFSVLLGEAHNWRHVGKGWNS